MSSPIRAILLVRVLSLRDSAQLVIDFNNDLLKATPCGFELHIDSYTDKLPDLLRAVAEQIAKPSFDPARFELARIGPEKYPEHRLHSLIRVRGL